MGYGLISDRITESKVMVSEPLLKLYFVIPFSIETYAPITMENIEEDSRLLLFMQEHKFVSELERILQLHQTKRKILSDGIRLKAVFGKSKSVFFVDRNGIVLNQDSGTTFRLTAQELESLEKRLESFRGIIDVTAYQEYKKKSDASDDREKK